MLAVLLSLVLARLLCCLSCRLHHPVSAPRPGSGGYSDHSLHREALEIGNLKLKGHTHSDTTGVAPVVVAEHSDGSNDGTVFPLRP